MLPVFSGTAAFSGDQTLALDVSLWDTPFLVLEGSGDQAASAGLRLDVRQPLTAVTWDLAQRLEQAANPAAALSEFTDSATSQQVISDGRWGNAIEYWAGGAPGHHGVSQVGAVGYRFRGSLRPAGNRAWFSSTDPCTITFAFAGNGWFRIDRNGTTVVVNQSATEADFLATGLTCTAPLTVSGGEVFDFYYVQRDEDKWGGFVFKAIPGDVSLLPEPARNAVVRAAPVVGAGLFDVGTAIPEQVLNFVKDVEVARENRKPAQASFDLALVNPGVNDGSGWIHRKDPINLEDRGALRYLEGNDVTKQFDLRRKRLVRIRQRLNNEAWDLFTGLTHDWTGLSRGTATVVCTDAAGRAVARHDRTHPDRIDYMAFGFRRRRGTSEPVYDIPAFDNWPLEYAIRCLMIRSGLDESLMRQPLTVPTAAGGSVPVRAGGQDYYKFQARTLSQKLLRLARAVHYGNYGAAFRETRLPDDEYIFKPEPTQELWARATDFSDRYGYDLIVDQAGHLVLRAVNNPSTVADFGPADGAGVVQKTAPEAYAGTYIECTNGQGLTKQIEAARIDLSVGRFVGAGSWNFTVATVAAPGVILASGSIATAAGRTEFFYDYAAATDGINSTVATLYSGDFDTYVVTLTASGTVRADCLLGWHYDPDTSRLPAVLRTDLNALSVSAIDAGDEARNHVIVVGRRKATVTDSEKLGTTADNPESEFVVARAVDVRSITDPTALHYVGSVEETIIYSDGIVDDDFAQYLARTFIYRYRNPPPGATVEHTPLPFVQLRDPVLVQERKFGSVSDTNLRWVQKLQHARRGGRYTTNVEAVPFPEYPSFEPRTDIDIDLVFSGQPAVDVQVSYTSLTGDAILNASGDAVRVSPDMPTPTGDWVLTNPITVASNALDLSGHPWPPVPGTMQIRPANVPDAAGTTYGPVRILTNASLRPGSEVVGSNYPLGSLQRVVEIRVVVFKGLFPVGIYTLTQNPADNRLGLSYQLRGDPEFPVVAVRMERTSNQRITLPDGSQVVDTTAFRVQAEVTWVQGKQFSHSGWISNNPYHQFFDVDWAGQKLDLVWEHGDSSAVYDRNPDVTQYYVRYRQLPADYAGGVSPLFDPYTSELGYLVQCQFDLLISGYVRVSVRSRTSPSTVVAWLTEPTVEDPDPETHWQYMTAGSNKTLYWDGVDAVGAWNFVQSDDYANNAASAFEQDQRPKIGKGFYVWNRERDGGNLAPLGLIDRTLSSSQPVWGAGCVGPWASWFILVEAQNDDLEDRALAGGPPIPRKTDTRRLFSQFQNNGAGSTTEAYVHTHLPVVSRVKLAVSDWIQSVDYNEFSLGDDGPDSSTQWFGLATVDATINNQKPIRIRFTAEDRPGVLWTGNQLEQSVRLLRVAHLKALIHDQFVVFNGVAYPDSTTESREVVSRRLVNDTHTLLFEDANWRKAKTFKPDVNGEGVEWIFQPRHFKKNFTGRQEDEELEFGNYLQLEEVPKFDPARPVGGPRSRLQLAFMAYLFYLSVYTQDRSGRYSWAINPAFADKSKIVGNTRTIEWPDDPMRQHRRTILTRQWTDERVDPNLTWFERERGKWNLNGTIGEKLLKHKWSDHDPLRTTIAGTAWSTFALATDDYTEAHRVANQFQQAGINAPVVRQLTNGGTGGLGLWTFEDTPTWHPCIMRDFWPYHLIPPMADYSYAGQYWTQPAWFPSQFGPQIVPSRSLAPQLFEARETNYYGSVDSEPYNSQNNTGNDPAKGDLWSSGIWDMTQGVGPKVRFWSGTKVAPKAMPLSQFKITAAETNMLDYVRQDDWQHWEEFRGIFSRGPRPAEQPKKVTPILPYYLNSYSVAGMVTEQARNNPAYPLFIWRPANHFWMNFREQYVWESASLFPVNTFGRESLAYTNLELTRFEAGAAQQGAVRYDAGGWVGWKDDGATLVWDERTTRGVFDSGRMLVAVGPSIAGVGWEPYMHLVLINERRQAPVTPANPGSASNQPNNILFSPTSVSGSVGQFVQVNVLVRNSANQPIQASRIGISVADPAVVNAYDLYSLSSAVVVQLRAVGSTTVTITVGAAVGSFTVTVS